MQSERAPGRTGGAGKGVQHTATQSTCSEKIYEISDVFISSGPNCCVSNISDCVINNLQALRSFKVTLSVDPKYHPKIIGRKGAVISQIRKDHDVNVQFPDKNDEQQVRP